MLNLYVIDNISGNEIPAYVREATDEDLISTKTQRWQTAWTSKYAKGLPNKVALCRSDNNELLGLMSYNADDAIFAVEIIYIENARHSNSNLLHITGEDQKYLGIAKALLAYAIQVSMDSGYFGVLILRAKTTKLRDYYKQKFGAKQAGRYDEFRLIIWEDEAEEILRLYKEV